jgi:uncharacterized protein (UPF0332 family)
MSFNWELYIQLAEELISYQGKVDLQEAYLRSAMSRCYYSLYCIARNHLIAKDILTSEDLRDAPHQRVRDEYHELSRKSSRNVEKKIARNLGRLWKERIDADYKDEADIDVQRAKTALDLSKRTLEKLREIKAV